jgi:glutamate/tyrosine decarboxylase-like PLP-dependent enzyme
MKDISVAKLGLAGALQAVGKMGIQVITALPHSSLRKAASIVGLGRDAVQDMTLKDPQSELHVTLVEEALRRSTEQLSIVVVSCGEVNTGHFGTDGASMIKIREVCDEHGAWLHVDAAFGLSARILDKASYPTLSRGVENLELADSIAGDAHKLLNVVRKFALQTSVIDF